MLKFSILLSSFLLLLTVNTEAQHLTRKDFDKNWKFKLDSVNSEELVSVNDAGWRTVDLPHDWSIEGPFSESNPATAGGGALPGGIGWYRKTFSLPLTDKGKDIFIDFDGVYKNSEVWINDHYLGKRPNGYISFQYDLTPYLKFGDQLNVIAVKVDNSKQPNSRWYSGSGIYRNVWLTAVDKIHVDQWGTFITTPHVSKNSSTVNVTTHIDDHFNDDHLIVIESSIYDPSGKKVAKSSDTMMMSGEMDHKRSLNNTFNIPHPQLWSIEQPSLYKCITSIKEKNKVLDSYTTSFGIRYFDFNVNKGFILNDKPVKIIGVCDHQDLGALGSAVNTRALQRQLEILKGMGCNGIRTSHNPPAPELLDLCDKMGFIVMDEAFDMWAKPKTKYDYHLDWNEWHKKDLEDQVLRDRNHPSIFIWSVGNEIPEQGGNPAKGDTSGRTIARELVGIVKALDTTREIVTANDQTWSGNNIILSGAFDLVGYNYHQQEWGSFQKRWPGKKFIITESTSALETRGYYDRGPFDSIRRWPVRWDIPFVNPNGSYTVSAYDNISTPWGSTHEESIKELLKYDFVSGMFIWTGFDYLGEPTPYTWPARSSYFGIIDLAGFPKDVYYLYKSLFTNTPVLHIYPSWNWKAGDTIDIVCYYNHADDVELFLNGRSLGSKMKKPGELHLTWHVPFQPGTVKAVSKAKGKVVLTTEIRTAGKPAKILLTADRKVIHNDGKDISFITATIVDDKGVTVPDANNLVRFSVNGSGFIAGVDSGDPVSHESFKGNQHTALNGKALVMVQSNGKAGMINVTATGTGLAGSPIIIQTK